MLYTATTKTLHTETFTLIKDLFDAIDAPDSKLRTVGGAEIDRLGVYVFNSNDYLKYRESLGDNERKSLKGILKFVKENNLNPPNEPL